LGIADRTASRAAFYGLGALERILQSLDAHLAEGGRAQVVTVVPGSATQPTLLLELVEACLSGSALVKVNPAVGSFARLVDWVREAGQLSAAEALALGQRAVAEGMTHLHLCLLQYEQGPRGITVAASKKVYHHWEAPLQSILQG